LPAQTKRQAAPLHHHRAHPSKSSATIARSCPVPRANPAQRSTRATSPRAHRSRSVIQITTTDHRHPGCYKKVCAEPPKKVSNALHGSAESRATLGIERWGGE